MSQTYKDKPWRLQKGKPRASYEIFFLHRGKGFGVLRKQYWGRVRMQERITPSDELEPIRPRHSVGGIMGKQT